MTKIVKFYRSTGRLVALTLVLVGLLVGSNFAPLGALAQENNTMNPPSAMFIEDNKEELGKFVREYLLTNPGVVREALEEYSRQEEQKRKDLVRASIEEQHDKIFNSVNGFVVGNPEGTTTLVEFVDYNCGYCRRAASDLTDLINDEPDLRIVLREFPILGQASAEASAVAIAVHAVQPELYLKLHLGLLTLDGEANDLTARALAASLGVDEKALEAAIKENRAPEVLQESYSLAGILGINGTPAYVIGDEIVEGAIGSAGLKAKIANVRQCGKTRCG